MLVALEKGTPSSNHGNLFHRNLQIDTIPNYSDHKKNLNLINERIKLRKSKLNKLVKNAEMELKDLESRL
jgi:hypothetical protein